MIFRGSLLVFLLFSVLWGDEFVFEVKPNKTDILVGESLKLDFVFKYKSKKKIAELNFTPPSFENLYLKRRVDFNTTKEDGFTIMKKEFILTSSKAQKVKIEPAIVDLAILKNEGKEIGEFEDDFKTFETKPLSINVTSFSEDTILLGEFNITSSVDKLTTISNNPINLTITIKGKGNFENIKEFDFKLKDVTIYKNKPIVKENLFIQKFALVSNKDFTIPAFLLKYFDKNQNKTITKKTTPIFIKIKPVKTKVTEGKSFYSYPFLVFGFLVGALFGFLVSKLKRVKKVDPNLPLLQKVKLAKDNKEILKILLPYSHESYVKNLIQELEEELYEKKEKKLTKKIIYSRLIKFYNNCKGYL